jgi:hypothetical protein
MIEEIAESSKLYHLAKNKIRNMDEAKDTQNYIRTSLSNLLPTSVKKENEDNNNSIDYQSSNDPKNQYRNHESKDNEITKENPHRKGIDSDSGPQIEGSTSNNIKNRNDISDINNNYNYDTPNSNTTTRSLIESLINTANQLETEEGLDDRYLDFATLNATSPEFKEYFAEMALFHIRSRVKRMNKSKHEEIVFKRRK